MYTVVADDKKRQLALIGLAIVALLIVFQLYRLVDSPAIGPLALYQNILIALVALSLLLKIEVGAVLKLPLIVATLCLALLPALTLTGSFAAATSVAAAPVVEAPVEVATTAAPVAMPTVKLDGGAGLTPALRAEVTRAVHDHAAAGTPVEVDLGIYRAGEGRVRITRRLRRGDRRIWCGEAYFDATPATLATDIGRQLGQDIAAFRTDATTCG